MNFELTDAQKEVLETFKEFAYKKIAPRAVHIDESEEYPRDLFEELGRMGFLGLPIPEEYGGAGTDFVTASLISEEFGKISGGFALSFGAHAYLCAYNMFSLANEAQRRKYIPKLCSGEWLGAFALTEPGSGSDSTNLSTTAIRQGNEYILNGGKIFITNGSIADIFLVYARTPRGNNSWGVSAFIVEKNFPGFSIGRDIPKIGTKGSPLSELIFTNCRVPAENLLGREGHGVAYMLKGLDVERSLLSGLAVGAAQASFEFSLNYAKERRQFGQPIASFQLVQEMLAQMATEIEAARLLVRQACWRIDQKMDITKQASYAKLFCAQMATRVTQTAMQVLGGYGYCKEFPVERFWRDAALISIGGGTSEIQKLIIARELIKERPKKAMVTA